uniref:Aluminum-activated malate transporter n=1 Tax=Oryza barthii TaxID=65489 RepID=A0A0D3F8S4_9ORYZ
MSAAALALGMHWVASKSGETLEPFVASGSVILMATAATFSRFIPTVNARFDYGVSIFVMTYSFVAVSGYRVDDLAALVLDRIATIAIGVIICLAVCTLICPVWAGQELGLLTARNMEKLASAVEACVEDYFADPTAAAARSEGYKSVLGSKASEDSQAARWEAPARAVRLPTPVRPVRQGRRRDAPVRVLRRGAHQLRRRVVAPASPAPASPRRCVYEGWRVVRAGAQGGVRLRRHDDDVPGPWLRRGGDGRHRARAAERPAGSPPHPSRGSVGDVAGRGHQHFTVALLLIEIAARIEGVVHAVGTLATLAGFKPADDADGTDKPEAEVARSDESPPHRKIWQTRTLNRVNILAGDKKVYKLLVGVKAEHFSRIPISKPWCRGAVLHQYVSTCSNVGLCLSGPQ